MRPSFINLARLVGARYRLHKDMYMSASGNAMAGGAAGGAGGAAVREAAGMRTKPPLARLRRPPPQALCAVRNWV